MNVPCRRTTFFCHYLSFTILIGLVAASLEAQQLPPLTIHWDKVTLVSKSTPTYQVVVNPPLRPGQPLGIAAYKAAELVRALQRQALEVHVVMTEAAQRFVQPLTFASLSGHKVITSLWDEGTEGARGDAEFDVGRRVIGE